MGLKVGSEVYFLVSYAKFLKAQLVPLHSAIPSLQALSYLRFVDKLKVEGF